MNRRSRISHGRSALSLADRVVESVPGYLPARSRRVSGKRPGFPGGNPETAARRPRVIPGMRDAADHDGTSGPPRSRRPSPRSPRPGAGSRPGRWRSRPAAGSRAARSGSSGSLSLLLGLSILAALPVAPAPQPGLPAGVVGAGRADRPAARRPDRRAPGGAGRRGGGRDLAVAGPALARRVVRRARPS